MEISEKTLWDKCFESMSEDKYCSTTLERLNHIFHGYLLKKAAAYDRLMSALTSILTKAKEVENLSPSNVDWAWEKIQKLQAENAKLKAQLTWRPASELPEEDQVIATYLNSYGKRRRVMAVYIRQYEEEAGVDDESCVEYCEEQDEWYLREGWYELIDNWGDYSLVAIVEGVVDYWMPVPPASPCPMEGR